MTSLIIQWLRLLAWRSAHPDGLFTRDWLLDLIGAGVGASWRVFVVGEEVQLLSGIYWHRFF